MAREESVREPATLSWGTLDAVAARHGASFYVADVDGFEDNYRRFLHAFRELYPKTSIGYSYKTNYLPAFILRADELGAYSEVVSPFEYDYARQLGIPGERIIFNGPIKRPDELADALASGAIVNVDSVPELGDVIRVAEGLGGPFPVGIRCYLSEHAPRSRFGIDLATPGGRDVLAAIDGAAGLRLAGLHNHQSGDRSAKRYRERTKALIDLHASALDGRPLDFVDVGGGFGGNVSPALAAQLASPPATLQEYAEAVAGQMREAYGHDGPRLILEPGMALLADTMTFVTRVETTKPHRGLAVVDGSVFNARPLWDILRGSHNPPITVVPAEHGTPPSTGAWDVVGHSCVEVDVLHRGHEGPLAIGDYVVVENVGAYTTVLNAPFIRGTPPIIEMDHEGATRVLRPELTAQDLARSNGTPGDAVRD